MQFSRKRTSSDIANSDQVVMVTPVAFANIQYRTYVVFAVINAFIIPCVYFFYPETAGRSLEELDEIFHDVSGFKGAFDVVHVAKTKPRRYGKNGELLINYEDTPEAQAAARRRSTVTGDPDPEKAQTEHVDHGSDTNRTID